MDQHIFLWGNAKFDGVSTLSTFVLKLADSDFSYTESDDEISFDINFNLGGNPKNDTVVADAYSYLIENSSAYLLYENNDHLDDIMFDVTKNDKTIFMFDGNFEGCISDNDGMYYVINAQLYHEPDEPDEAGEFLKKHGINTAEELIRFRENFYTDGEDDIRDGIDGIPLYITQVRIKNRSQLKMDLRALNPY